MRYFVEEPFSHANIMMRLLFAAGVPIARPPPTSTFTSHGVRCALHALHGVYALRHFLNNLSR